MSEEDIKKAYKDLVTDLNTWGTFVDETIKRLLSAYKYGEIQIMPKHRVKDEQSFITKALYRGKRYEDPMHQIEDKVGTRIITLVTDIVDKVSIDLKSCNLWNIKESKSKQEVFEDIPEKFGYQSIHYIVTPKDNCCTFATNDLKILTCEIQVRTLLQHAYAEISHDNVYKGPYKNDPAVLRQLAKSMALMEAADDYFCKTLDQVSAPQNNEAMLLNYLVDKFKELKGSDKVPTYDTKLAEEILSFTLDKPVSNDDINQFLKSNHNIKDVILYGDSILCQQPIIILLAYYLDKYPYYLKDRWDIDYDLYTSLCRNLGYSPE